MTERMETSQVSLRMANRIAALSCYKLEGTCGAQGCSMTLALFRGKQSPDAPSNHIDLFLLALSSSAYPALGCKTRPSLTSLKMANNELAEILILCPRV